MSVSFSLLVVGATVEIAAASLVAVIRQLGLARVRREAGLAAAAAGVGVAAGMGCYSVGNQVADDIAEQSR